MSKNLNTLTRRLQRSLKAAGYDPGPVDGIWGMRTARAAVAKAEGGKLPTPADIAPGKEFDSRTEKNLATLQPGAQKKLRPFIRRAIAVAATHGLQLKVICGDRDREGQEAAKRKGASKAGYGYSWHNFGMAIDFGLFRGSSYVDSDDPSKAWSVYQSLGALAKEYGIEWGGSWRSFVDPPHFHVDLGRSSPSKSDRKKLFAGTWSY